MEFKLIYIIYNFINYSKKMGNKVCCTAGGGDLKEGDTKYDPRSKKLKKTN